MALNPWLALIFGILIGWLLEWLLERWFFRNREQACQHHLAEAKAQLQARELELHKAHARAESLENALTGLRTTAVSDAVVMGPEIQGAAPGIAAQRLAAASVAPQLKADLPQDAGSLPALDMAASQGAAMASQIKTRDARSGIEASAGFPGPRAQPAEASSPEDYLNISSLPALEVEPPQGSVDRPQDAGDPPKATVDWPEISATVGRAEGELPALDLPAAASIGAELPAAPDGLPDAAIVATLPDAQVPAGVDDLAQIKGIGRAWVAEAETLARAAADDLIRIEGIGPVYAGKLNAAGITTFAQLAEADEAQLSAIIQAPAWRRVNYGEWITQARLAAAGDEAGLKTLQDTLFNRVRKQGEPK